MEEKERKKDDDTPSLSLKQFSSGKVFRTKIDILSFFFMKYLGEKAKNEI